LPFTIFNAGNFPPENADEAFNDVKIFIFSPKRILNQGKFIEKQLTRDARSGVWICEMAGVALNLDDNIEYWIYVEKSNLGYFTKQILAVQGNECVCDRISQIHLLHVQAQASKKGWGTNFGKFCERKRKQIIFPNINEIFQFSPATSSFHLTHPSSTFTSPHIHNIDTYTLITCVIFSTLYFHHI
jgi:hypothetical protein